MIEINIEIKRVNNGWVVLIETSPTVIESSQYTGEIFFISLSEATSYCAEFLKSQSELIGGPIKEKENN